MTIPHYQIELALSAMAAANPNNFIEWSYDVYTLTVQQTIGGIRDSGFDGPDGTEFTVDELYYENTALDRLLGLPVRTEYRTERFMYGDVTNYVIWTIDLSPLL